MADGSASPIAPASRPARARAAGASRLADALFAFGIASVLVLPHWVQRFALTGTALDPAFLGNHVYLTAEWRLSDASALLLTAALIALVYAGRRALAASAPPLMAAISRVLPALLIVYVLGFLWYLFAKAALRLAYGAPGWLPEANELPVLLHPLHLAYWLVIVLAAGAALFHPAARRRAGDLVRALSPVFVALGLVTAGNGALAFASLGAPLVVAAHQATPAAAPEVRPRRVLWLVFDQLDGSDAFLARDPSVAMPHFDRLVARSLFFPNAASPHNGTQYAIPALLTGRRIAHSAAQPADLALRLEGAPDAVPLSRASTVFSRLHAAGARVGVVAQSIPHGQLSIPYCSMFGAVLAACWNEDGWAPWSRDAAGAVGFVLRRLAEFALPDLSAPRTLRQREVAEGVRAWREMRDAFDQVATAPGLDVVLAHWMVPHYPHIWDRAVDDFAWGQRAEADDRDGFLSNLELADRTLGLVLERLRRDPIGRDTVLVVTGDHGNERDVPLIVHLPDRPQALRIDAPVSTLGLGGVIEAIVARRLAAPEAVAAALADAGRGSAMIGE